MKGSCEHDNELRLQYNVGKSLSSCTTWLLMQNPHKTLEGEPERNKTQESMCIWKDNIKIDIKEMGWESEDWVYVVQVLANMVIIFWFHKL